ncbi:hypothetical protein WJX72_008552 [[Myrmecia] bisecta]|uniref:Cupin type-2 domain-containing protein n=1 Tax=[Myrmecia] bisecta TaxID=41462 RepID=A0AAW1PXD4_9CHLO
MVLAIHGRVAPHGLAYGAVREVPVAPTSRLRQPPVCQLAIRRSLGNLALHKLAGGRYLVPLLQPEHDQLPFAMALEVYASPPEQPLASTRPGASGLYELRYILDGSGQVIARDGRSETLAAGDSVLMPLGGAAFQAQSSKLSHGSQTSAAANTPLGSYQMACLVLVIPEELLEHPEGGQYVDATGVASATEAWQAAPVVGSLSVQQATAIMTNRLALVFEPGGDSVPFTFGVEIFEPGHRTMPHTHKTAHELFFILAGDGTAFCDGERFAVKAGDSVVFPPALQQCSISEPYMMQLLLLLAAPGHMSCNA